MIHSKTKKVIAIVCVIIVITSWGIGFYDINTRFPNAEVQKGKVGEWVNYSNDYLGYNNISFSPQKVCIYSYNNYIKKYPDAIVVSNNESIKYVVMNFVIKNDGSKDIMLNKLFLYFAAISFPTGWTNRGKFINVDSGKILKPNEQIDVSMSFVVSPSMVVDRNMQKFLNSHFQLCLNVYPVKKILEFDTIEKNL